MHDKFAITPMDGYIYVEVFAKGNSDEVLAMWKNIVATCNQQQCFNILGISRFKMGIDTLTGLDHHSVFLEVGIDHRYRIAWVGETQRTFESIEFIKNVLANRSIAYGRIFTDENKAKTWLMDQKRKKASP